VAWIFTNFIPIVRRFPTAIGLSKSPDTVTFCALSFAPMAWRMMSSKGVNGDRTCDEHHNIVGRPGDKEHQVTIIINIEFVDIIPKKIRSSGPMEIHEI
jgi:hypothetical protein